MSLILKLLVALDLVTLPVPPVQKPLLPVPTASQLTKSFVTKALATSSNKLSPGRKQVVADLLISTALRSFDKQDHREYWIALIGAESGFDGNARSPAGATGLGQLLPQYREEFGRSCGLAPLDTNDVRDDATNLALSACYFKSLIEATGSVPLALAAYNSGLNSAAVKSGKAGSAMNAETANHVAKIWISREGK